MALDPATLTDEQIARLRTELSETIYRMEAEIEAALRRGGGRLTTEVSQRLLKSLLAQYEDVFGRAERELLGISADVLEAVGTELEEMGIADQVSTPSEALLQAQAGDALDALTTIKGERSAALRAALVEMARSTVNPTEAVDALRGELGTTLAQTLSLVDTTVAGLDRTLTTAAATESGFTLFLLDGPVDDITRPWCRERVGYLFTLAELDETPNDTGPNPPTVYAGGYSCRHRIIPIDRSEWGQYPRWQNQPYPSEAPALAA